MFESFTLCAGYLRDSESRRKRRQEHRNILLTGNPRGAFGQRSSSDDSGSNSEADIDVYTNGAGISAGAGAGHRNRNRDTRDYVDGGTSGGTNYVDTRPLPGAGQCTILH